MSSCTSKSTDASSDTALPSSNDDTSSAATHLHSGIQPRVVVVAEPIAEPIGPIRRADRWLREHSMLVLVLTMISAFSWPEVAAKVFARGSVVKVPFTAWTYDVPSLALSIIIFAAAIRCTPGDFVRAFRSKGGAANLASVYLLVPAVTLGVALAMLRVAGEGDVRSIAFGLVLLMVVPVATTAAMWTRSSQGAVPLSLSTIAISSLVAVFVVPPVLGRLAGVGGLEMSSSIERIRTQVVFAFAVPLLLGTALRTVLPRVAAWAEPLLSLGGMIVLLAFIGDTTAALRPHLVQHTHLLAIALPFTVLANVLAYATGYAVARLNRLDESDTIALVFGSGMRSTSTALVLSAICFAHNPIVALAPILWSVTQQVLAGYFTRRFLAARDRNEPVLPLKRRVAEVAARAKALSGPAITEIEEILEDTLVIRPRKAAPSRPG